MADHPALTASEIAAIRARIGTETARQLAAAFDLHEATIRRHTRGMKRALRRDGPHRSVAPLPSKDTLARCWEAACKTIEMTQMART